MQNLTSLSQTSAGNIIAAKGFSVLGTFSGGGQVTAGKTYYVSKQGNGQGGLSWSTAFTTLAAAITANNLDVATYTNVFNYIYVDGGNYTESLVAFPNHAIVIGVGVPSDGPRVNGSVVLTSSPSVCHFYNMQFRANTAAPCVDMSDVTAQGVEFHHCLFNNTSGVAFTYGVCFGSANYYNKIVDCSFIGNPSVLTAIHCEGPENAFMDIRGNTISAVTTGILFDGWGAGIGYSDYQVYIRDNIICRTDPNSGSQLVTGINFADTQSRSHATIVNNYIAAATPLVGHNTYCTMHNIENIAGDGRIIVEETT